MTDYRGSKGGAYNTTYSGSTPVELFDAGRWGECLHACAFILFMLKDGERLLASLDDEAALHELIHLVVGIDISTHNCHENIRAEVAKLWADFCVCEFK
jgi:hypothetical protein